MHNVAYVLRTVINGDDDSKKSRNVRLYENTHYQDLHWLTLFFDHIPTIALYAHLPIFLGLKIGF